MNACVPYVGRFLASSHSPQQLPIRPSTRCSVTVLPRSGRWPFAQACQAYEAAAQLGSTGQLDLTTAPPPPRAYVNELRVLGSFVWMTLG